MDLADAGFQEGVRAPKQVAICFKALAVLSVLGGVAGSWFADGDVRFAFFIAGVASALQLIAIGVFFAWLAARYEQAEQLSTELILADDD